jgi:hypothetical protein
MSLLLPLLREDQSEIVRHKARIKVIAMGRRWGKTTTAGALAISYSNYGAKTAWVVPTYKNSRTLWRFAERAVSNVGNAVSVNKTDKLIQFRHTGGLLGIYSADNDVGLRGEDFDLVIVEEASKMRASTFHDVIWPTLADRDGRAILIFTPSGRNWVWHEKLRAEVDMTGRSIFKTAPSSANPNPKIKRAYELARERFGERSLTFRQEWDAEFVEGEGSVFSRVNEICNIEKPRRVEPYTGKFVAGLDLAQKHDYTVLVVLDANTRRQVDMLRVNKRPWLVIRSLIKEVYRKWNISFVIGEANSIGGPNIEAMQDDGLSIVPFDTTSMSKAPLIESLVQAFEQDDINLFDDPVIKLEFEAYEKKINPITGRVTYAAPTESDDDNSGGERDEEIHDDIIMATALAWRAITNAPTISVLNSFQMGTAAPAGPAGINAILARARKDH